MKRTRRPKSLALKVETLRLLEVNQLSAAKGGGTTALTSTVFSEGACETYSWWYACEV
jgi:hypothetical protein